MDSSHVNLALLGQLSQIGVKKNASSARQELTFCFQAHSNVPSVPAVPTPTQKALQNARLVSLGKSSRKAGRPNVTNVLQENIARVRTPAHAPSVLAVLTLPRKALQVAKIVSPEKSSPRAARLCATNVLQENTAKRRTPAIAASATVVPTPTKRVPHFARNVRAGQSSRNWVRLNATNVIRDHTVTSRVPANAARQPAGLTKKKGVL